MNGVLNFLKPPGMTSHDAVALVRRLANQKRVGHTGTLDPAAAGVLPICLGHATRLVEYLQAGRKTYIAELTFGLETDSHDATGTIVSQGDASGVTLESLRRVLDDFRGDILQTPPIFSAIKKDGQKLYELARGGTAETAMDLEARPVTIHKILVTRFLPHSLSTQPAASPQPMASSQRTASTQPRAILEIECGSGTYIRSLARDIGRALGCGATMSFLVRTHNGAFSIEEAMTPESLAEDFSSAVTPFTEALKMCAIGSVCDDEATEKLARGQKTQSTRSAIDNAEVAKPIGFMEAWKRTKIARPASTRRMAFVHSNGKIAVLAETVGDEFSSTLYKPEKVFFLERD